MPKDIWPQVQVPGITFGIQSLNSTFKRFQNMWNRGQKLEVLSARPLSSHPHLILPQQKRPIPSYSIPWQHLLLKNTFVGDSVQRILAHICFGFTRYWGGKQELPKGKNDHQSEYICHLWTFKNAMFRDNLSKAKRHSWDYCYHSQ